MGAAIGYAEEHGIKLDGWMIDVEGPGRWWGDDVATNRQFLEDMIDAAKGKGVAKLGIYVSTRSFDGILGSDYTGAADAGALLWWSAYGRPSFDDFQAFVGWTTPFIRQYDDAAPFHCDIAYDRDYCAHC